jgi:hypothetical protein
MPEFKATSAAPSASRTVADAYLSTSAPELVSEQVRMSASLADAGRYRPLGHRPLIVLSSARPDSAQDLQALGWTPAQGRRFLATLLALHEDEASWSSRGRHEVVSDASHYLQFDQPDRVVNAVREVINAVRADWNTSGKRD